MKWHQDILHLYSHFYSYYKVTIFIVFCIRYAQLPY